MAVGLAVMLALASNQREAVATADEQEAWSLRAEGGVQKTPRRCCIPQLTEA